ncbi:hypothetical protein AAFC00_003810 [Neodothiora populina]|uniref:CWH43-like N-terminal domain-containing protein n=1 Tax=Neodothiora populina TaxID=2781224 RepID=A0ABR3PFG3_9PEZI
MYGISYWIFPLFAALCWLGTLLGMLLVWVTNGKPHYADMDPNQHIAYISDIGATNMKPLFIAGSAVTVVIFDGTFIAERWLRHRGRLAHNTSWAQKWLSIGAITFAVIGALGLIFLTIFDTVHYHSTHDAMLVVFIAGYIISAIFICAEYQRLGIHYREHRILRASFWIKLCFIIVELCLAIAFAVMSKQHHYNRAAVLEWTVSLIYIFYVGSFVMDFLPAVHSKHNRFPSIEMGPNDVNGPSVSGGPVYAETSSYDSRLPMQQTGGFYSASNENSVAPSRNF